MPFTTIKVIENVFTNEQKKEMLKKVTEALIDVCGEKTRRLKKEIGQLVAKLLIQNNRLIIFFQFSYF